MRPDENRTYRTKEFAELAGVTVRALRYYDRLGLLKPKRSPAGYRTYSARDFERLEQIIALKFIGVPLKKIRFFTTRTPEGLAAALRAQRQTLEARRHLLDQAIAAIGEAEHAVDAGHSADPALYRRIIEVIEMQNNSDWNKKYEGLVQAKIDRLKSLPQNELADLRQQWAILVGEIQEALGEAPDGAKAQALAARWVSLLERLMGGPVDLLMIGSAAAYENKGGWSPSGTSFADERVWTFMKQALAFRR
jgi:MerR family transcriptional regulator, thiopeptide resistance regulator